MREKISEILIDGKEILMPDRDIEITRTDLDDTDSGRDESGVMHRFILRERVQTWAIPYDYLTAEEYEYMKSLTAGKAEFPFTYFGEEYTAYCSNDSITLRNAKTGEYRNFTLKIIEC